MKREWHRTACLALATAAGCSSASGGSTDAGDASVDAPSIPADGGGFCFGALDPNCGILTVMRVADCTYALSGKPPIPVNVAFYLAVEGGITKIPQDRQDREGWDYVDMTYASIRLFGSWCDMDRAGTLGPLSFAAACIPGCIP